MAESRTEVVRRSSGEKQLYLTTKTYVFLALTFAFDASWVALPLLYVVASHQQNQVIAWTSSLLLGIPGWVALIAAWTVLSSPSNSITKRINVAGVLACVFTMLTVVGLPVAIALGWSWPQIPWRPGPSYVRRVKVFYIALIAVLTLITLPVIGLFALIGPLLAVPAWYKWRGDLHI